MFDTQRLYTTTDVNQLGGQPIAELNAHRWVTVTSPINKQSLLQACDNCGVVKSQHTLIKRCSAEQERGLITRALRAM